MVRPCPERTKTSFLCFNTSMVASSSSVGSTHVLSVVRERSNICRNRIAGDVLSKLMLSRRVAIRDACSNFRRVWKRFIWNLRSVGLLNSQSRTWQQIPLSNLGLNFVHPLYDFANYSDIDWLLFDHGGASFVEIPFFFKISCACDSNNDEFRPAMCP